MNVGVVRSNASTHIVTIDLELSVEVQVQIDEAGKGSRGVATGHALERVINLVGVARADVLCVVEIEVARGVVHVALLAGQLAGVGLAGVEKVRAQATDEPLDEDLEHGGGDQGVEKADDAVVDVPEGADPDLHEQDEEDRDQGGHDGGGDNGDDLLAQGVCELRVDDLAVVEGDGKGAIGGRVSHVDTETDGAHGGHGEDVEPGVLEPLAEGRARGHGVHLGLVLVVVAVRLLGVATVVAAVVVVAVVGHVPVGPGSGGSGRVTAEAVHEAHSEGLQCCTSVSWSWLMVGMMTLGSRTKERSILDTSRACYVSPVPVCVAWRPLGNDSIN